MLCLGKMKLETSSKIIFKMLITASMAWKIIFKRRKGKLQTKFKISIKIRQKN